MNIISPASLNGTSREPDSGAAALANISINQLARKRKRGSDVPYGALGSAFTIRPCPASVHDKPQIFRPVSLIPRGQLPLSYLDVNTGSSKSSQRLFSARIPVLESHDQKENQRSEAHVLIARLEADGSLFAVEEVQHGIFALCRLGNWVKEDDVTTYNMSDSILKQQTPTIERNPTALNTAEWWRSTMIEDAASITRNEIGSSPTRLIASRPQESLASANGQRQSLSRPAASNVQNQETHNEPPYAVTEFDEASPLKPSTPDEVCSTIIKQYLDTLYLSKASLAYFAKGPLSRARVAFTGEDENMRMSDLISFLQQSLLIKSMEKKYRHKLPEIVHSITVETPDSSEKKITLKKKRSKKLKPSTDGIFPGEEEYVKEWWHTLELNEAGVFSPGGRDTVMKRRTAELRIRETQMQLILAMEVLALEGSPSLAERQNDAQTDAQPSQPIDIQGRKKRNDKKSKDLVLFLDVLVDRLCIWQSLQQDDRLDIAGKDKKAKHDDTAQKTSNDALKAFCVDIIIPFYMSRLPKQASSINRKFGGPATSSPVKQNSKSQASSRKPGEPTARPKPTRPERKPLHRITSETLNHSSKRAALTPSLIRSATDSTLLTHTIKRESSEVPSLSSIPAREPPMSTATTRPATARFSLPSTNMKRFSQREVDLDAMTSANQAKLRRKAEIDRKLKEAISTVKKPRRGDVSKEVVEEAERRRSGGGASATMGKGANPRNRTTQQAVEVTATPKRGRKNRDVVMVTPHQRFKGGAWVSQMRDQRAAEGNEQEEEEADLPSSSFVPSTAVKAREEFGVPDTCHRIPDSARALMDRRMNDGVAETPSRGPAKRVSFFTSSAVTADKSRVSRARSPADEILQTPVKPPAKATGQGVQ